MQRFFRLQLGNWETFRFWQDNWSGHGHLSGVFPRLYALSMDPRASVQQAWHRAWARALPKALSDQRVAELLRLQELLADQRLSKATQDAWVWNGPSFIVRAVYRLLRDQGAPEDPRFLQRCHLVWKRRLPLKIKIFVWLLLRRRLMTRSLRQRMVPDSSVDCSLCARGWKFAHTCSSPAHLLKKYGRRRMLDVLWRLRRRHSGDLLVAVLSVEKLSGSLSLPHFGPFGPIRMRSISGAVPLPLMLSCTRRGGLLLFGSEVA